MFLNNYPCMTSKFCHSVHFKGISSAPAILMVHGYTGSPYNLIWMGRQINDAGYSVYIPRLPGHGTNAADFNSTRWQDWVRRIFDVYIDMSAIHETVFVAGHSMGGLIASLVAARFNPKKLLLFAPAFATVDKHLSLTPFLKLFLKTVPDDSPAFYTDPEFLKAQKDYIGVQYVSMAAEFYKLMLLAKRNLPYVKAKSLVVLSEKDQRVPLKEVRDILEKKLKAPKEYLILKESSHATTDDVEKEQVAKRVLEFLKD